MSSRPPLVVAPFGVATVNALKQGIRTAQGRDPLAPVDVIVPTAVIGVTLRRAVAGAGLANVRFSSLPQLAERLAARHLALTDRRPVHPHARLLATRAALRRTTGSLAEAAARHPATLDIVDALFAELDTADTQRFGALDLLIRKGSPRAGDVARLYRAYRDELGLANPRAVDPIEAAIEALEAGHGPDTRVVLFAPRHLAPGDRRLLAALATRDRLTAVVGTTAEEDEDTDGIVAWLSTHLGEPQRQSAASPTRDISIVVAPDPEEEARLAVRGLIERLDNHRPRPERIAIAYHSPDPYLRALVQVLDEAGLPFHAPAHTTLAQTAAGRTVAGLLALHLDDYPRTDVIRWLSDAPVRIDSDHPVPAHRWDWLSRDAHVTRGAQTWQSRLEAFAAEAAADPENEHRQRRAADARALAEFVAELRKRAEEVATARTWSDASAALRSALERYLGTGRTVERWPSPPNLPPAAQRQVTREQLAYDAVLSAVDDLASLDQVSPPPTPDTLRSALARQLDRPAAAGTTLGRGVIVAPISQLAGADLDLLVVVGMTEDAYPPRLREHAVLRDADRKLVGDPADGTQLLTTEDRRRLERRQHLAALAGARHVVLSYAVADIRGQRRQFPSPWLLEEATRLAGRPVSAEELPTLTGEPWLSVYPSFVASLDSTTSPASRHELDVALAQGRHADAIDDARYQRGREAVQARANAEFGRWLWELPPLTGILAERAENARNATLLQRWATCPASYLFQSVFTIKDLEDAAERDTVDPLERGSLVHAALERFLRKHLADDGRPHRDPDAAWTSEEVQDALTILEEEASNLEAQGLTGRPALWRAEVAGLRRALTRLLADDSRLRREQRSWPVAVEMPFGREEREALRITLPDGRVIAFSGTIDRVDMTESGRLIVIDYKTGKGYGYDMIPAIGKPNLDADLTEGGRKIQLTLYGLAAEDAFDATVSHAYYWFVEQDFLLRGGPLDERQRDRLRHVLDVEISAISEGKFPANPGPADWKGWIACRYCAYDRMCSTNRSSIWERLRDDARVAPYAALADGSDLAAVAPSPDGEQSKEDQP
jgi:ATP-dependent helicase/nuclease subunit B